MQGQIRACWIVAALSAAMLSVSFAFPHWISSSAALVKLCFVALMACAILLFAFHATRRRHLKEIGELVGGRQRAHWTYTEDEWRKFADYDWSKQRRTSSAPLLIGSGLGLVVAILLALREGTSLEMFGGCILLGLALSIPVAFGKILIALWRRNLRLKRVRILHWQPRDI